MNQRENWNNSTKNVPSEKIHSQYSELKEPLFSKNSIVYDVGGGTGLDSIYFIQKGHAVILSDISDVGLRIAITRARKLGLEDKLTTHQIDLENAKIMLQNNSIDVVYSRLAIHHFSKKKTTKIIKELSRILKVTGRAYIIVKSSKDKEEMDFLQKTAIKIEDSVYDDKGQIKSRFTMEQWKEILNNAKIKNFKIKSYTEDLSDRGDKTRSRKMELVLLEIIFGK